MTADSNADIRRYAVVGTSARAGMYIGALAGVHARDGVIVAWCDQPGLGRRVAFHLGQLRGRDEVRAEGILGALAVGDKRLRLDAEPVGRADPAEGALWEP